MIHALSPDFRQLLLTGLEKLNGQEKFYFFHEFTYNQWLIMSHNISAMTIFLLVTWISELVTSRGLLLAHIFQYAGA